MSRIIISIALRLTACGKKEEGIPGRVETKVGDYVAVATDCFKPFTTEPQQLEMTADSMFAYRFVPCSGADIMIEGNKLTVNGSPYGTLQPGDTVLVDHGQVFINSVPAIIKPHPEFIPSDY
ncbi:MAG: hypothetical protein L0Y80_11175 [Ignavibacteriae bacterium]|nr:hypothetical protein [Ignavibacteriota bacterium]